MTQRMIKYPSTGQFRDAITQVQHNARHHGVTPPKVVMEGTVKLHGTNAAVCFDTEGNWWCQSRERIITPESDNAGFAAWAYGNKNYFDTMAKDVIEAFQAGILEGDFSTTKVFQIVGEWCGGNIQHGVGITGLDKMFVVFAIRWTEDVEGNNWVPLELISPLLNSYSEVAPNNVYSITDFGVAKVLVDFNNPALVQNSLIQLTEEIEKNCPVARYFRPDAEEELVGEGVVWSIAHKQVEVIPESMENTLKGIRFKVKGEKHSVSKVKTIAPIDLEKVKSVDDFVEYACTENRLNQGMDKLTEMGLEHSIKNTGEFIKWIMQDILKEELPTMTASLLEPKDVNGKIANKSKAFYFAKINTST